MFKSFYLTIKETFTDWFNFINNSIKRDDISSAYIIALTGSCVILMVLILCLAVIMFLIHCPIVFLILLLIFGGPLIYIDYKKKQIKNK
jgi:hypothetical protein